MKQQSVMKNRLSEVAKATIPRSSFDRSHGHKTTFDAGLLIPFYVDEVLPGDTLNVDLTAIARLATPIFPIMDNMKLDTHYFAVPIRLIWDNWQKFNGEQVDPDDSTDFTIPQMLAPASGGHLNGSLSDYFGIPTQVADLAHSSLWHRGYNLIWNEWFRDENLQDSLTVDRDNGPDTSTNYTLQKRGKRYDYFTSCLPWPQKGDSVTLPLGTSAPIIGSDFTHDAAAGALGQPLFSKEGSGSYGLKFDSNNSNNAQLDGGGTTGEDAYWETSGFQDHDISGLTADLTDATSSTVNDLREAFQLQKLLERDARGGSRYTEIVKSHFGVTSPDSRLQRPEYLGGGSTPLMVSQIAQTSSTDATTPQGNLSAFGYVEMRRHGFVKSFTEHCIVIGLVSARADLTYQQGLNRMFSRLTRYDFYWPSLSHIGEQAVLNKEIYADGTANDELVFGYQERYAEMRYKPSLITGKMRSNDPQPLDAWHLSQNFATLPVLGSDFIEETPPMDRILAVPSEPDFIFDSFIRVTHARPLPTYGVPGLIDHF